MATVPPGNKQIGTVKAVAVSSVKVAGVDAAIVSAESIAGFSILAPASIPTPSAPKNAMVGKLGVNCISGSATAALIAESVVGFAVLRFSPPQVFNAESVVGFSVLRDSTNTSQPVAPQNAGIGMLQVTTVSSSQCEQLCCESIVGFVVIREFHPRKEHVTITIEYGADAKLNIGDNS